MSSINKQEGKIYQLWHHPRVWFWTPEVGIVAIVISHVFGARSDLHLAERVQLEGCPDWTWLRTWGRAMVVTCQQQGSPEVVPCFINYIPLIGIIFYNMITMLCGKRLETGDWNHELITQTVFWGSKWVRSRAVKRHAQSDNYDIDEYV